MLPQEQIILLHESMNPFKVNPMSSPFVKHRRHSAVSVEWPLSDDILDFKKELKVIVPRLFHGAFAISSEPLHHIRACNAEKFGVRDYFVSFGPDSSDGENSFFFFRKF